MLTQTTDITTQLDAYYDGYAAKVFLQAEEFSDFAGRMWDAGLSFRSKIIKGRRAGKYRREFIIMLVEKEKLDDNRD